MSDAAINLIIAVVSALLGGGGYAAYVRAQGQNRVDLYTAAVERITKLEARSDEQDKRNDQLARQNAEQQGMIGALTNEKDGLNRRLETQRVLIDDLNARVARLGVLEEENARLRQQLQVETSKREFLEREVNALRQEVASLRQQLTAHEAPHE